MQLGIWPPKVYIFFSFSFFVIPFYLQSVQVHSANCVKNCIYVITYIILYESYPSNRLWRPIRLWDIEDPTFSRQLAHVWQWGCQLYALITLYPPQIFYGIRFC
jgi:hypothetical protein